MEKAKEKLVQHQLLPREMMAPPPPPPTSNPDLKGDPKRLDNDTVDAFLEAGQEGQKPNTQEPPPSFEEYLKQRDPVRLYALRLHIKWVRKEARRYGLDEKRIGWWLL